MDGPSLGATSDPAWEDRGQQDKEGGRAIVAGREEPPEGDDGHPSLHTFGEKLNYLFRHVHPSERGEYSYREVAGGIEQAGGPTISPTYLMYLRKGQRTNPSLQHVEAIATFFGVPPAYFLDEATTGRVAGEVELVAALQDAGLREVALRMADLSAEGLAAIKDMVDQVRRAEGKDVASEPADPDSPGTHQ